jgi:hypothetical protein
MASQSNNVLTEELLAAVEQVGEAARSCGLTLESLYHGRSGASAGMEPGWPAEERKNWLT